MVKQKKEKEEEKDTVRFTISMPGDAYEDFKAKAKSADVSMSKFMHRAGSIVNTEQIIDFPKHSGGVATLDEQTKS